MRLRRTTASTSKKGGEKEKKGEALISRQAPGMCFAFHPKVNYFNTTSNHWSVLRYKTRDFPGSPVVEMSLSNQEVQIQSLVRGLRSHMSRGQKQRQKVIMLINIVPVSRKLTNLGNSLRLSGTFQLAVLHLHFRGKVCISEQQ